MAGNMVSAIYFVSINQPFYIVLVGFLSIWGIILLNEYAQSKHDERIDR